MIEHRLLANIVRNRREENNSPFRLPHSTLLFHCIPPKIKLLKTRFQILLLLTLCDQKRRLGVTLIFEMLPGLFWDVWGLLPTDWGCFEMFNLRTDLIWLAKKNCKTSWLQNPTSFHFLNIKRVAHCNAQVKGIHAPLAGDLTGETVSLKHSLCNITCLILALCTEHRLEHIASECSFLQVKIFVQISFYWLWKMFPCISPFLHSSHASLIAVSRPGPLSTVTQHVYKAFGTKSERQFRTGSRQSHESFNLFPYTCLGLS